MVGKEVCCGGKWCFKGSATEGVIAGKTVIKEMLLSLKEPHSSAISCGILDPLEKGKEGPNLLPEMQHRVTGWMGLSRQGGVTGQRGKMNCLRGLIPSLSPPQTQCQNSCLQEGARHRGDRHGTELAAQGETQSLLHQTRRAEKLRHSQLYGLVPHSPRGVCAAPWATAATSNLSSSSPAISLFLQIILSSDSATGIYKKPKTRSLKPSPSPSSNPRSQKYHYSMFRR